MIQLILVNFFELLAFVTGLFYYKRNKSKPTFYFVLFLGITVFIELVNWYPAFINNGILSFLKGSVFESNYFLGNCYCLISYLFYITYFKWYLSSRSKIFILNIFSILFILVSFWEYIFSGYFFNAFLPISNILGTLIVILSIGFYYMELLRSEQILEINRSLPFYVSIGALFFHLCTTPLFIYSSYYSHTIDPIFVSLYRWVILGSNYLLYSIYTIGLIICYTKRKPYFSRNDS